MKEIMTQKEFEEYFGVSTNTVASWRKKGLRRSKVGNISYYMADSIKEFFKSNEIYEFDNN